MRRALASARANLEGADLRGAKMNGTYFTNANLRYADLRGIKPVKVSLEGADLRGAKVDPDFFQPDTFLSNTVLPNGAKVSGQLTANLNTKTRYITSKCQLTTSQQSTFEVVFSNTFIAKSIPYRFYVGQYMDGSGVFCIANKDFTNAYLIPLPSIQNRFFADIKRVQGKPIYKFTIRDGNGMNVPVTRYRLQLRDPKQPQLKPIDQWIDNVR